MNDFDDLLTRSNGFQDLLADALIPNLSYELAGYLEVDVSGEQGLPHFLKCFRHVFFTQLANAPQVTQGAA